MTTTPTLNGQIIGQAERSTRAVLDALLADTGTTFEQWVALNVAHDAGPEPVEADLVQRVAAGLRIDGAAVLATFDELVTDGLVARRGGAVELTDAGGVRHDRISAGIAGIVTRLYRDLAADDLATAARVLTTITGRANAELASR
jgi:hypothetical protein